MFIISVTVKQEVYVVHCPCNSRILGEKVVQRQFDETKSVDHGVARMDCKMFELASRMRLGLICMYSSTSDPDRACVQH